MTTVGWQTGMKPEYKTLQILKKDNDYLMNLTNSANIKIHVKAFLPWLRVINLRLVV
jgi:hypothetical protein